MCLLGSFPYFLPSLRFSGARIPNCQKIKEGRKKRWGGRGEADDATSFGDISRSEILERPAIQFGSSCRDKGVEKRR